MKTLSVMAVLWLTGGAALANPTVTNQDVKAYTLQLDCKHISASSTLQPDSTEELREFKVASNCKVNIYPVDNPFGKDGHYDPKKLISSSKVKRDSECVIQKRRVKCE